MCGAQKSSKSILLSLNLHCRLMKKVVTLDMNICDGRWLPFEAAAHPDSLVAFDIGL